MDHLMSYDETIHPIYFLTRFMEGLREDIQDIIIIQRPLDLDATSSLAYLLS